jgi:hypothetical protein
MGPVFRSDEEQTAVKLIRQLREMNALGTTAGLMDPATHDCRSGEWWPDSGRCVICGGPMTVRPHECSPRTMPRYTGWNSPRIDHRTTCLICGREM